MKINYIFFFLLWVPRDASDIVSQRNISLKFKNLPFQVGDLIALTVEEGQDWKDVQIPGVKASSDKKSAAPTTPAAAAPSVSGGVSPEAEDLHFLPGIGPATNLLLAQYGLEPRYGLQINYVLQ